MLVVYLAINAIYLDRRGDGSILKVDHVISYTVIEWRSVEHWVRRETQHTGRYRPLYSGFQIYQEKIRKRYFGGLIEGVIFMIYLKKENWQLLGEIAIRFIRLIKVQIISKNTK